MGSLPEVARLRLVDLDAGLELPVDRRPRREPDVPDIADVGQILAREGERVAAVHPGVSLVGAVAHHDQTRSRQPKVHSHDAAIGRIGEDGGLATHEAER